MKILITGATGLIGTRLLETLILKGYEDIRVLTTNKEKAKSKISFPIEICEWNPIAGTIEKGALENVSIVFHLAGEGVAEGRWSEKRKKSILDSRVKGTSILLREIKKSSTTPKKFISSSAVGIYGSSLSDKTITSEDSLGEGFLAEICKAWENSLRDHDIKGMNAHTLRTGVVLSEEGGALAKMLPPFTLGLGGKLGSGKQYMSWIHIDDLVNAFLFLMTNDCKKFSYNGVSPTPVTNLEFTKVLGNVLKRPTIFPVPGVVLKLIFGEMSEILLEGQRVSPTHLDAEGFEFKYKNLYSALSNILKYNVKGEVLFKRHQWVKSPLEDVFQFFSDVKNLETITPKNLSFKIVGMNTDQIKTGSLIDYKLKIHGIPAKWKTKINNFEKNKSFIDEQLKGPYSKWVHQHDFQSLKNGTLISDKIVYKVPFGILGNLVSGWFISRDVKSIFNYRNAVIDRKFN
ncbi:TIGR01777 family oxidoreductase [Halobacteriovorax sp. JY17]|uniref:TIGR01777 family oxidoreductase n=1 Tax=Halobacteriovorax sp. JY17 TaxID=2014617 RepID=UPI0025C5D4E2|nr:TIGR01777 family oxidoreductase [Halobacteriovorax sp. JY17]